jgi:hypothetical protein
MTRVVEVLSGQGRVVEVLRGPPGTRGLQGPVGPPGDVGGVVQWQANVAYNAGRSILNPSGELVRAPAAAPARAAYTPSDWTPPASATYAPLLTPATTVTYNADGTVATETRGGVTRAYTYANGNLTAVA